MKVGGMTVRHVVDPGHAEAMGETRQWRALWSIPEEGHEGRGRLHEVPACCRAIGKGGRAEMGGRGGGREEGEAGKLGGGRGVQFVVVKKLSKLFSHSALSLLCRRRIGRGNLNAVLAREGSSPPP